MVKTSRINPVSNAEYSNNSIIIAPASGWTSACIMIIHDIVLYNVHHCNDYKNQLTMIDKNKKSDHKPSGTSRHGVIKGDTVMSYTSQNKKCKKQW